MMIVGTMMTTMTDRLVHSRSCANVPLRSGILFALILVVRT